MNHLYFPTYSRGPFIPFIRSVQNIANMYCTECIIGIIQNAGTPSRLRFARTRRDEGRRERQASNYGSPFLHTTEIHSQRPNIANLALDLRSILAMIVPVLVGPLAEHANSLSAPLQRPIRSVQILRIYDAPSLPRKDIRFDQELPSIRGSKVWRKGSRPVAWLDGMVEILVSDNRGREKVRV